MNLPERIITDEIAESVVHPDISANERRIVLGILGVLTQAKKFDVILQSPEDSIDVMPGQDQYVAGDTIVTVTPLPNADTPRGMLELQIEPFGSRKTYKTIVSLAFESAGLRSERGFESRVVVTDESQSEFDAPFPIKGVRAVRMQQIILERTARNLAEKAKLKTK